MKIKLETADKIFEAVSLLFLIASALIIAFSVPGLPDTVPIHFNLKGEPNGYGSKNSLWTIIIVSGIIYMLMGLLSGYPHLYNYPSQKTDKEAQYKLGSKLMRSIRAWILFFLMILSYVIVQSAKSGTANGAIWLIAFVLAIVFGHLTYFAITWKKIK